MATPSLDPPMNLPPLPVTPLPPPPSSSSPPPPALTVAHDQTAAASEIQDQRLLLPRSSASCDTAVTVEKEEDGGEEAKLKEKWLTEMQGCLVVLATLVASVTYSAGVNVPGGFWQDDSPANSTKEHTAGNPVLADKDPFRYRVFFLFNANAFATSVVLIALLLKRSFFHSDMRLPLLIGSLFGSLISLVVAFCAGSARSRGDVLSILCMLAYACLWIYFLGLGIQVVIKEDIINMAANVVPRNEC